MTSINGLSNSYISKIFQLLQQTFKEAILRDLIIKNPMLGVDKPKSKKQDKKIEALTFEEHKMFIGALKNRKYEYIFLLAINTGMRIGEILSLRVDDIDFKEKCIKIRRTVTKDVNTHMLRHTFATRCIEAGMPAPVLQRLLGHADISTTINSYTTIFNRYKVDEVQ